MGQLRAPSRATSLSKVVAEVVLFIFVVGSVNGQDKEFKVLTPANFNIAQGRTVSVNATCGEDYTGREQGEVYCKLVGYDSMSRYESNEDIHRKQFLSDNHTYTILEGHICDYCYAPEEEAAHPDNIHPAQYVVDGDTNTRWQSPPISRGIKFNRVTLEIDLQQLFQVAYVVVTMANSPRPGVWVLERSVDNGQTWSPWQYFAGNDRECYHFFGKYAFERRNPKVMESDDEVICTTLFSKVLPIEDGEIFVSLTQGRPSAKSLSPTLEKWIQATNIRLRMLQTKTMLGDLMSVAQGDSTVTRRYYYSIKEIDIGGRCVCNGHAFVCPPSRDDPDLLQCQCQHNTTGINCDECGEGYLQKRWRPSSVADPFVCEKCNCNGHSDKCHFDDEAEAQNLSMDNFGQMLGGGFCDECQDNTKGINCHECEDGYYRPENVLPNATQPCIECQCTEPLKHTGNCEIETGKCECTEAYRGADDCSKCADGYYDYPDCKPCDCFSNGTQTDERGIPFCVSDTGIVQCPCKYNFAGEFCDKCEEGYYNFPECEPCECNGIGSNSDICDLESGQCSCKTNYGERQCDQCSDGFYYYPDCNACSCDGQGSKPETCNKNTGQCLCRDGFNGLDGNGISRCDRCEPGYFGFPTCQNCSCSEEGSLSRVCDETSGKCQCKREYGGRQCDECSPGFFNYPECSPCGCNSIGSQGISCEQTAGTCRCRENFQGEKCDECIPDRYNYPLCEECNCDPSGVPGTFFAQGGCANVAPGTLCTCKERVTGRICDTCKPLFWKLEANNPDGCTDCGCHRPGTIGALGVCDVHDGQCACKPFVGKPPPGQEARICSTCKDGYYGLEESNGFGCKHCQCDVGGSENTGGRLPICDKDVGTCRCKPGMIGRKCNEVQNLYYLPSFHQFKKEIEDGYRQDDETVRIGYKDQDFPGYSWKGYAVYSKLQDEVLMDVGITTQSTYQMILRYTNPNPTPVQGKIVMHAPDDTELAGSGDGDGSVLVAETVEHDVLLPPTGGQPAFAKVSGLDQIYTSSFDLSVGTWKASVKIENKEPNAEDILVDYFVLVPKEYYDPTILKEDVYVPCRAGQTLPLCAHYSYPELYGYPTVMSTDSRIPGRQDTPYGVQGREDLLAELNTQKLTTVANYQTKLHFPIRVYEPEKEHVLAIVFFTPSEWKSNETAKHLMVQAGPMGPRGEFSDVTKLGEAYVYNCPYSSLCRQVVIDAEGRVMNFNFEGMDNPTVEMLSNDNDLEVGIDSIVAIPIDQWSLDYVTPQLECVRKNGNCIPTAFPNAPGPADRALIPFSSGNQPEWVVIDGNSAVPDVNGRVPNPGMYILVAQYKQKNQEITLKMNITKDKQNPDQFYEAVLPLPTCMQDEGCRSVIRHKNLPDGVLPDGGTFDLIDEFNITTVYPTGPMNYPVSIESVTAIPLDNFGSPDDLDKYLMPEMTDRTGDYANECAKDYLQVGTNEGFCRNALISIVAEFNAGAIDCDCKAPGSVGYECDKFGGQCPCKPNVIGRQCTRCKPGFFGFPDCKQCNCPPTATCDETTGDCICAPHVTGTEEEPCSMCEENTFGYDPITGCQECGCVVEGTINGNMSCSLESGNCYCKENVEGRKCDACVAGAYQYPGCLTCPCDRTGTEEEICDQTNAECKCKRNVEGECCNQCATSTFNLQENNPDGCTGCVCSGKNTFCTSHNHLIRSTVERMDGWTMHAFKFSRSRKDVGEKRVSEDTLQITPRGELDVSFTNYPDINLDEYTLYYKAPEAYLRNKIRSYGGEIKYNLLYSGYEIQNDVRGPPDMILRGADETILHRSGRIVDHLVQTDFSVQVDPIDWRKSDGQSIDRKDLMVMLANLKGLYIRASYSNERDGRALLKGVSMDFARVAKDTELKNISSSEDEVLEGSGNSRRRRSVDYHYDQFHSRVARQAVNMIMSANEASQPIDRVCEVDPLDTCQLEGECVTSVELCECPEGYHGFSCEDCSVGYYRSSMDPLGPVCEKCKCNGHAETCHPHTGECIQLQCISDQCPECYEGEEGCGQCVGDQCGDPGSDPQKRPWVVIDVVVYCQFHPDKCVPPDTPDSTHCKHNTTGEQCENCAEGFYGDATDVNAAPEDTCQPCHCPLQENNFALSCGAGLPEICVCKPNYIGDRCETCRAGYYGEPETIGDFCKPCDCNGNINVSDPNACNSITGICQECLDHTYGDHCERCEDWYYGDAVNLLNNPDKECQECECNREGTESCDHMTGVCTCKPGIEGALCDVCKPDFFDFGNINGCSACNCSPASIDTQCHLETGQCECKPGVSGQKCERCNTGYWNLQSDGCEICKCKTEFAVGQGCDQETGQCKCLDGVVGINCDGCPNDWVLVMNETRKGVDVPQWKQFFGYDEGCYPCPSCVSDSLRSMEDISGRFETVYRPFRESGGGTGQFAKIRLQNTQQELNRLLPEIGLLDPVERLERLQPLERQAFEYQTKAKSLNVEYKLEKMSKLKSEAEELEKSAKDAIRDMQLVRSNIVNTTNDMREIADGLGSGVSQDQIRTSIDYGERFLKEIRDRDFSGNLREAIEEQVTARELVGNVTVFTLPGKVFKTEVVQARRRKETLDTKLADLKTRSQTAGEELRFASTLNFKNTNSPAAFKRDRINEMIKDSKDNNELGRKMENTAKRFLRQATGAFDQLNTEHTNMEGAITLLDSGLDQNNQLISENNAKLYEAQGHAQNLESQAANLQSILDLTKIPAAETLRAAGAYETIEREIKESEQAANDAKMASDELATMTVGIKDKADQSKDRTQQLNEAAQRGKTELSDELSPKLERSKLQMDEIASKNKATKQSVEGIITNIRELEGQREVLKSTVQEADDAETIAHDALISIAQRAEEITEKLKISNDLQQNHTEMSYAIGATKKALEEIEKKRQKRQVEEEDFKNRLERLLQKNNQIDEIRKANEKMLTEMKLRIRQARSKVADLKELGVTFQQGSSLELRNPPRLTEMASCTPLSFYFNVTKSSVEETAFLFYLGNEVQTHQKMPLTSTDDYMALEIIRGGYVKLTVDLGRGDPFEITSNAPISYNQWHQVIVDRRGHFVTLTVKSEQGVGEINEDKKVDQVLPRIDQLGRPVGDVFNLHPEYSRIFVGGFPVAGDDKPRIQDAIRETDMNGQIEGLEIGGEAISLWNYKKAGGIKGARPRDKFRTKTDASVRFGGLGYIAIPNIKKEHPDSQFVDVQREFNIKLKFKTANGNGILIIMGDEQDGDFVCLELVNQVVRYSFNLGDGTITLESNQTSLNVWQTVEIRRNERQGTLVVNGATVGQNETTGQLDRLSVEGSLYLGGYPGTPSYEGISSGNFSGCIESLHLDGNPIDLSRKLQNGDTVGVRAGCAVEPVTQATFSPASPGYVQLNHMDLNGRIDISFMFRTLQEQALLFYMSHNSNFYWISLSLTPGGKLKLYVFPNHILSTGSNGKAVVSYNDNNWHVVTIVITKTSIQLRVDDYEDEKVDINNDQDELPLMTATYQSFIGGVPQDVAFPHDSTASIQPFIGCVRDVLVDKEITDFNARGILYKTPGIEIGGICRTSGDPVEPGPIDPGSPTLTPPIPTPATERTTLEPTTTPGWGSNFGGSTQETPIIYAPTFGQCKLPLSPAIDPNERAQMKGLRFGTKAGTYLEFHRQLKVKRRSEFSIEFKTTHRNGIIFYVANARNVDFIALFMKNGRIIYGFNCGSGTAFIESSRRYDDGQWHGAVFSRIGKNGVLKIDGALEGEIQSAGQTEYIEVERTFFLGNVLKDTLEINVVRSNLQDVLDGFVGCLNNLRLRDKMIGRWRNNKDVIPCSEKVEPGYFFGRGGGSIMVYRQFRVGLDFDITMSIKPRNITGLLLGIQGRRDYLLLQMVDGTMTFTVDNGRGPITAVFKPGNEFDFCDGKWHEIHAVKAKNVVTLSVDDIFAQPGIGVPGVSSTDTKHGLFIGGHPKPERLTALETNGVDYVGCVKDIVIESKPISVETRMLRGNIMSHICPTI